MTCLKYHLQVKHIFVGVSKDAGAETGSTSPARQTSRVQPELLLLCHRCLLIMSAGHMVLGNAKHSVRFSYPAN